MQHLAEFVAAVTIAHAFHAFGETANVRTKLQRAVDAMNKKALKPYPINIDTRAKAYGLGLGLFVIISAIAYGILMLVAPSITTLLWITAVLIVIVELYNLVALDKYHISIQSVIDHLSKK
jgi:hypothetical protein